MGIKDRKTKQVRAQVVENTKAKTLQGFILDQIEPGAKVYTDDSTSYGSLPDHETVKHSLPEYVRGEAHTNGVESFWSMLKGAHAGTFHKISPAHLHRYVAEFTARHNMREQGTLEQMGWLADRMVGTRLRYRDLVS